MWSRTQRQLAVKLFLRRIWLVILAFLVVVAGGSVWGVYGKEQESGKLRAEAEAERNDLFARQERLEAELGTLNTDRGLEEALREQYALAERGERLIVIVDAPTPTPTHATSSIGTWFKETFWWW